MHLSVMYFKVVYNYLNKINGVAIMCSDSYSIIISNIGKKYQQR